MPNFTLWAHVGFTDVIGLFMLCLDRGPTQGVRQLSMSSTMGPLYTIDHSSQQCQLAHSFILAVLSMGPLMIFAHCCLMGQCGSVDIIGLFILCLDRGPTQAVRQLSIISTTCPLFTIVISSQQCQLAHSFISAVLSMGPLTIFAHCCLMGPYGSINIIGLFTLCLDHGPT